MHIKLGKKHPTRYGIEAVRGTWQFRSDKAAILDGIIDAHAVYMLHRHPEAQQPYMSLWRIVRDYRRGQQVRSLAMARCGRVLVFTCMPEGEWMARQNARQQLALRPAWSWLLHKLRIVRS